MLNALPFPVDGIAGTADSAGHTHYRWWLQTLIIGQSQELDNEAKLTAFHFYLEPSPICQLGSYKPGKEI